jgi:hypothetical protein
MNTQPQPKAILEELLKLLGFDATVEEHPLDDGLLLDVQDRGLRPPDWAAGGKRFPICST